MIWIDIFTSRSGEAWGYGTFVALHAVLAWSGKYGLIVPAPCTSHPLVLLLIPFILRKELLWAGAKHDDSKIISPAPFSHINALISTLLFLQGKLPLNYFLSL